MDMVVQHGVPLRVIPPCQMMGGGLLLAVYVRVSRTSRILLLCVSLVDGNGNGNGDGSWSCVKI